MRLGDIEHPTSKTIRGSPRPFDRDPHKRYNESIHPRTFITTTSHEFVTLRYAILGSGAVGALYGGMMARHGHDVHFLLHSDYDHVKQHGLRIDSKNGDFVLPTPNVYRSVDDMPRCDVVILAMKSTNNALLSDYLPKLVNDNGVVLSLQNGLDVEADCVSALRQDRSESSHDILGGCCFLCSNKVGPGHIKHLDYGKIIFGRYQHDAMVEDTHAGQQILDDMRQSGIDANWTDDLAKARWRKLMWNIPFNGLSVALNASTNTIIGFPPSRALADTLIREVHRGAAACGITLDEAAIEQTMEHTETMVPYDSSMRLDFLAGRPMEVQAIFANPIQAVTIASKTWNRGIGDLSEIMPSVVMLCQQLQYLDSRIGL